MCMAAIAPSSLGEESVGGLGYKYIKDKRREDKVEFAKEPSGFRRGTTIRDPKKLLIPLNNYRN